MANATKTRKAKEALLGAKPAPLTAPAENPKKAAIKDNVKLNREIRKESEKPIYTRKAAAPAPAPRKRHTSEPLSRNF